MSRCPVVPFLVVLLLVATAAGGCSGERERLVGPDATASTETTLRPASPEDRPDPPPAGTVAKLASGEAAALRAAEPATLLIDVRPVEEYMRGHVVGAQNIDVGQPDLWARRVAALDRDRPTVVYADAAALSAQAAGQLVESGFLEVYDLGAMADWTDGDLPLDRPAG